MDVCAFEQMIVGFFSKSYNHLMQVHHKISVLVAEDNPVNQEVIIAMLQDYGINTELVENGRDAVDAIAREQFDLVFMDCQIPGMDGFEATSRIRNSQKTETRH